MFDKATVYQDRNDHSLLKDFQDEIPGYLNNSKIMEELINLNLSSSKDSIFDNMRKCYAKLAELNLIGSEEMSLLALWRKDCEFSLE